MTLKDMQRICMEPGQCLEVDTGKITNKTAYTIEVSIPSKREIYVGTFLSSTETTPGKAYAGPIYTGTTIHTFRNAPITDAVNSPSHYHAENGKQLWDVMPDMATKEEFLGYCKLNVVKYVGRYNKKNGIEDLNKVAAYCQRMIRFLEEEKKKDANL